jgi:hypothetical protein
MNDRNQLNFNNPVMVPVTLPNPRKLRKSQNNSMNQNYGDKTTPEERSL